MVQEEVFKWNVEKLNNKISKVKFQTWFSFSNLTKKEYGKFCKVLHKRLKQNLNLNCPPNIDKKRIIVDLQMRDEVAIVENSKSFMSCKIYLPKLNVEDNVNVDFVKDVFQNVLSSCENFVFTRKK